MNNCKHLNVDETLCQVICNKIPLDIITVELKDLERLEKKLIFKITLFKKIAITHG